VGIGLKPAKPVQLISAFANEARQIIDAGLNACCPSHGPALGHILDDDRRHFPDALYRICHCLDCLPIQKDPLQNFNFRLF
jgi:hypothetical protein